MADISISPTSLVTNGAIVNASNPLPAYLVGGVPATSITVGTTTVASGTNGRILYDNSGVLGEMTTTGSGTVVVLATGASLVTPALGAATATTIAIGGATIGANALAVTGHLLLEGVTSTGATGTGNLVFSASPTFTGTATAPTVNASTQLNVGGAKAIDITSDYMQFWSGTRNGITIGNSANANFYNNSDHIFRSADTNTTFGHIDSTGLTISSGLVLKLGSTRSVGVLAQGGSITVKDAAGTTVTLLTS